MSSLVDYPSPDACLMHLVRHGATPHNERKPPRLQGRGIDEGLSALGREQAERAAGFLAARPIAAIYSSPLLRAGETAKIIARPHAQAVKPIEALAEANVGRWEGMSWEEVQARDPSLYALFRERPGEQGYPEGETFAQVLDRVVPAFEELMQRHVGQEIVVVAHSVVNRCYLGSLVGVRPEQAHRVLQFNGGVSLVRWKEGAAKAITLNAALHLM